MKTWIGAIVSSFGFFIWIGGMGEYELTQNLLWFIAGACAASVLVVSGFTMVGGGPIGYWGALMVTALLTLYFVCSLFLTQKLMPHGLIAVLSLFLLILLLSNKKLWIKKDEL